MEQTPIWLAVAGIDDVAILAVTLGAVSAIGSVSTVLYAWLKENLKRKLANKEIQVKFGDGSIVKISVTMSVADISAKIKDIEDHLESIQREASVVQSLDGSSVASEQKK